MLDNFVPLVVRLRSYPLLFEVLDLGLVFLLWPKAKSKKKNYFRLEQLCFGFALSNTGRPPAVFLVLLRQQNKPLVFIMLLPLATTPPPLPFCRSSLFFYIFIFLSFIFYPYFFVLYPYFFTFHSSQFFFLDWRYPPSQTTDPPSSLALPCAFADAPTDLRLSSTAFCSRLPALCTLYIVSSDFSLGNGLYPGVVFYSSCFLPYPSFAWTDASPKN
jgi:hypothetical protein